MGCTHDRGTKNQCKTTNYNYGYRGTTTAYQSIMAYNCKTTQCDKSPFEDCPRLLFFSNPDPSYMFDGLPMGDPAGVGSGETNCAKKINEWAEFISNFNASKQPTTAPSNQTSTSPTKETRTAPSKQPSSSPSKQPTTAPSKRPSNSPSRQLTTIPSNQPSNSPSKEPMTAASK